MTRNYDTLVECHRMKKVGDHWSSIFNWKYHLNCKSLWFSFIRLLHRGTPLIRTLECFRTAHTNPRQTLQYSKSYSPLQCDRNIHLPRLLQRSSNSGYHALIHVHNLLQAMVKKHYNKNYLMDTPENIENNPNISAMTFEVLCSRELSLPYFFRFFCFFFLLLLLSSSSSSTSFSSPSASFSSSFVWLTCRYFSFNLDFSSYPLVCELEQNICNVLIFVNIIFPCVHVSQHFSNP